MKTRILHKPIKLIALLLVLCSSTSCMYYFKHITESPYSTETIERYQEDNKYLILHSDTLAWHLSELNISNDIIYAKLDTALGYQANYLDPKDKGFNRFRKKKEPEVINAVHLYTSDITLSESDTIVSILVSSINALKYNQYARGVTYTTFILPPVLIPVGFIALIIWIIGESGGFDLV